MRGQGSLEYLIIITLAIAVTAIVSYFAITYFSSQQDQYYFSSCRQAASICKTTVAASPSDPCSVCDNACNYSNSSEIFSGAVTCCKMGKSEDIYSGSTGCSGCVDDGDCATGQFCALSTHTCASSTCSSDADCANAQITVTACEKKVCADKGTPGAYCWKAADPTKSGTTCGSSTYGAWSCLSSTTKQRQVTDYKCNNIGGCVAQTPFTETVTCGATYTCSNGVCVNPPVLCGTYQTQSSCASQAQCDWCDCGAACGAACVVSGASCSQICNQC